MKVPLALITIALCSSVSIAVTIIEKDRTSNSISNFENYGVIKSIKNPSLGRPEYVHKRGLYGNTPLEKAQYHFDYLMKSLRRYVRIGHIDYAKFEIHQEDHLEELKWAEEIMDLHLSNFTFNEEIKYLRRFYEALKKASIAKDTFDGCDYTGSKFVEQVMELNVRILALNYFDEMGNPQTEGFETRRFDLEIKLKFLENIDNEMLPEIKVVFNEQVKETKKSFTLLMRYEEQEKAAKRAAKLSYHSKKKKENCPVLKEGFKL